MSESEKRRASIDFHLRGSKNTSKDSRESILEVDRVNLRRIIKKFNGKIEGWEYVHK